MQIFINGTFCSEEDAHISVFDHGLLYGDGIFEGIRVYNGKAFRLEEHIDRLFDSAKAIYLDIWMTKSEIFQMIEEAITRNNKKEGYIRLIVTRGEGNLGVDPTSCAKSTIIAITGDIQLYPEELYEKGIAVVTSIYRRVPVNVFDVRVKSLNYLNNVLAKIDANQRGCLESIMLNDAGLVTECTGDNLFIIKDGVLKTPALFYGALGGVTRSLVLELAHELGLSPEETGLTRYDLITADECFMTGTAAELMPVTEIDGILIGEGHLGGVTRRIIAAFQDKIRQA